MRLIPLPVTEVRADATEMGEKDGWDNDVITS
jgi:hypothetical protein